MASTPQKIATPSTWSSTRRPVSAAVTYIGGRWTSAVCRCRLQRRPLIQKALRWTWGAASLFRRRLTSRCSFAASLVVVFQMVLLVYVFDGHRPAVSYYQSFTSPSSDRRPDDDEDDVECRSRFQLMYEDYCQHSLRPQPSNGLVTSSSAEATDLNSTNVNATRQTLTYWSSAASLCPCAPADIEQTIDIEQNISITWDELLTKHAVKQPDRGHDLIDRKQTMTSGGRWRPTACIARQRVAIIVPFRGRDQHLAALLDVLHPVLRRQLLDFTIFVVEQVTPEIFNRGALMNVGYLEAKSRATADVDDGGKYDCFIFHDVDMLPESGINFYVCSSMPRHMAAYRSSWNYTKLYDEFFGGVNAFRDEHFELINGFSNKFYGWGGEDDDLLNRVVAGKLKLDSHYPRCVAKYSDFYHERDKSNPEGKNKDSGIDYRPNEYPIDGLNSLNYTVLEYREMSLYTKIFVSLPEPSDISLTTAASSSISINSSRCVHSDVNRLLITAVTFSMVLIHLHVSRTKCELYRLLSAT